LQRAMVPLGTVPDELRPEWMREAGAAQITGDQEEGAAILLRNWFPFEDVQALITGLAAPGEGARAILSQMRPELKFVAEAATGTDIFRRRPTEVPSTVQSMTLVPKALVGKSGTVLDNLLALRPAREYLRRVPEQRTKGEAMLRAFLGGAVQPIGAKWGLREREIQTRTRIIALRRKLARAIENRDQAEIRAIARQIMQMTLERRRLGLPIAKATAKALQKAGI